jgi:hypothetical protein
MARVHHNRKYAYPSQAPHGALNPPITGVAAEHDMLYALTLPFQDE